MSYAAATMQQTIASHLCRRAWKPAIARAYGRAVSSGYRRSFIGVVLLLFGGSVAMTIHWAASMSSMAGMPMPGGWVMSMAWMRMPGETWLNSGGSFVAMWIVMMMAMMLPSLAPALWHYQLACDARTNIRRSLLTALLGAGYFFVWMALGVAIYPLGTTLAVVEMRYPALARAVPAATAVVVLLAGALQFTAWKRHQLACCRDESGHFKTQSADARTAWLDGLRLGVHCTGRCASFTAILLVLGVMDLRVMVVLTAAIALERFDPSGERGAKVAGLVAFGAGLFLLVRAASLI